MTESMLANTSSSQIHFMWGQINEWFYHDLAGIQNDPAGGGGFKKIIIAPVLTGSMTAVSGSYVAITGGISDQWTRAGKTLTMDVSIPPNTSATIYVPAANPLNVTEGGVPASGAAGVTYTGTQGGSAVYQVGYGSYSFVSQPAGSYSDLWQGDGTSNVWSVGGPPNWTTYGGTAPFGQGDTISFDSTGSNNPPIQLSGTLSPSSVTVSSSNAYAFAGTGVLSGTMSLLKSGTAVLTLNEANTYSGATIVSGGTVQLSNLYALQDSPVTAAVNNALTFDNAGSGGANYTIGGLAGSGNIMLADIANNPVHLIIGNGNNSSTYAAVLGGSGSIEKTGTGTLILGGSCTYSGSTTVSGGVLQLSNSPPSSGPAPGSTLWLDAAQGVTLSGSNVTAWADQSGNSNNATGVAGHYATFTSSGLGGEPALSFNGSAYLSDPLSASNGAESIFAVVEPSVLANGSDYTLIGSANSGGLQLRLSGNQLQFVDEYVANIVTSVGVVSAGIPSVIVGTTQSGSQAFYINLQSSGTGTDTYTLASGKTTLIGENGANGQENFSGYLSALIVYPTVLTIAQIQQTEAYLYSRFIGNPPGYYNGALPGTAVTLSQPGATLDLNGKSTGIALLTGVAGSQIYLGGASLNLEGGNGSSAYAGGIADAGGAGSGTGGGIIKSGSGALTLSGALSYSGSTQVNAGTLSLSGNLAGAGPVNVANGACLNLSGGVVTASTLQVLTGGTLNGSGTVNAPLVNYGTVAATGTASTLKFSGNVVNYGTFILTGGAALQATGGFVNNGLLDVMTGAQTLPSNLVNNGIVLDVSAVKLHSVSYTTGTFSVGIQSYTGHTYQLQYAATLAPSSWSNLGAPAAGTGGVLSFTDTSSGASAKAGFYRILVNP
jgi:fibronectin-binding autotransporter adhesin